ncbi:MAG: OsmC family protein [Bacteroidia bacterium]|jgi:putative redox protein
MPTIHSRYLGELRTEQTHVATGQKFITDAPLDNQGRGEAISPTDSVCAALSACMMTLMGIAARTHEINLEGLRANVTKHMQSNPRKIQKIEVDFYGWNIVPGKKQRIILERAAMSCPVALSLHPDIVQDIKFRYD